MSRRKFLERLTQWLTALMGAGVGGVALLYTMAPALRPSRRREVLLIENLYGEVTPGEPSERLFVVERQDGWVTRREVHKAFVVTDEEFNVTVLSSTCTHAGCSVRWAAQDKRFRCPCHDGQFDRAGKVLGGPPPRPLERVPFRLTADGKVFIRVQA